MTPQPIQCLNESNESINRHSHEHVRKWLLHLNAPLPHHVLGLSIFVNLAKDLKFYCFLKIETTSLFSSFVLLFVWSNMFCLFLLWFLIIFFLQLICIWFVLTSLVPWVELPSSFKTALSCSSLGHGHGNILMWAPAMWQYSHINPRNSLNCV